jgi:hypothetical protein
VGVVDERVAGNDGVVIGKAVLAQGIRHGVVFGLVKIQESIINIKQKIGIFFHRITDSSGRHTVQYAYFNYFITHNEKKQVFSCKIQEKSVTLFPFSPFRVIIRKIDEKRRSPGMTYEYLPSLYACVMLGDGRSTRRLARRLFWKYNLTSHLLSSRFGLFCRLTPWIIHHRLPEGATDDIATLALRHLAAELGAYDRQPILLLGERTVEVLSKESLARLESCYLICREEELDALFASATLLAQGDMTV